MGGTNIMAKEDYGQLAKEVVAAVGGKDNIINVTNCMTRLRFVLKDDTIPNKDEVSKIKGVKGVMNQGGQYQVIIGTHVSEVVKFAKKEAGITENGKTVNKEDYQVVKKDSLWNRFFKVISGCIMPMIGPMIAGGILKGILVIMGFSLLSPLEFFVDPKNVDGRNNKPPAMRVRVDCYTKKLPFRVQ